MKKVLGNRVVAWVLLVLAVAGACFLGFCRKGWFEEKKKTELLKVNKDNWVCDSAEILSSEIKQEIMLRDREWESAHNSVVAVSTLPKLNRWTVDDYAVALGKKWGLDENAMLLLLVRDDAQCYLAAGAQINAKLTDQEKKNVISSIYIHINDADYNGAVKSFLDWAEERLTEAQLPYSDDEFDLGAILSSILPFSIGCSATPFKTIIIVIVVIAIISALSKAAGGTILPSAPRPAPTAPRRAPAPSITASAPAPTAPPAGTPRTGSKKPKKTK